MSKYLNILARGLFWVVFLGLAAYVLVNPLRTRYMLQDWWRTVNSEPTEFAIDLADAGTFTDAARNTFYASYPTLDNKQMFAQHCLSREKSFVLGCYDGDRIYILDVTDSQLDVIETVTGAHELLHAKWARYSKSKKSDLGSLLREYLGSAEDQRFLEVVDKYRQSGTEGEALDDELHSIIGTTIADIPETLEEHYRHYFHDRSVVVGLHESYESIFAENEAMAEKLRLEINSIVAKLNKLNTDLKNRNSAIGANDVLLRRYRQEGNAKAHNALLDTQRSLVAAYNKIVSQYNALLKQYNSLIRHHEKVSLRHNDLVKAIDSSFAEPID